MEMIDPSEAAHATRVNNGADAEEVLIDVEKSRSIERSRTISSETASLSSSDEEGAPPISRSFTESNERDPTNGYNDDKIILYVEANNIEGLIEWYEKDVSSGTRSAMLLAFDLADFYPDTYIRSHYVHSFDDLNEAARLGVIIAAKNGHPLARQIVADAFNFDESLFNVDATLCKERNERKTLDALFEYNLTVPFSMNYDKNWRYVASQEGKMYIQSYFGDRRFESERNPIILFNLGCALLNAGDSERAFTCFYEAGKKGMPRGYVKAAQLVVDESVVDCMGIEELDSSVSSDDKVRHILKDAGEQGQWYLATCSRYGKIKTDRHYYNQYHSIIDGNRQSSPYFYEYGVLNSQMARHERDAADKIKAYNIALSCFMNAMRVGQHEAHKDAEKVLHAINMLDPDFGKSDRYSEVVAAIKKSTSILNEFSIKSNKILGDLLAE